MKNDSLRILIVDDEKSMQKLLWNILSLAGFDVMLASNEAEFRECVFTHNPHIIILDIMLGEKDGITIYEDLLQHGLDSKIPVIFLSALAEDRPPSFPEPGKRYALLGKPFDADKLVDRLQKLTGSLALT